MEHTSILDRIELAAVNGSRYKILNLYPRTIKNLIKKGFDVTPLTPVDGFKDQSTCRISWGKDSPEGSIAEKMYLLTLTSMSISNKLSLEDNELLNLLVHSPIYNEAD